MASTSTTTKTTTTTTTTLSPTSNVRVADPRRRGAAQDAHPAPPRPRTTAAGAHLPTPRQAHLPMADGDDHLTTLTTPTTPTTLTTPTTPPKAHAGALAGQKPLPPASSPLVPLAASLRSPRSRGSGDVEMAAATDGDEASDGSASLDADGRSSRSSHHHHHHHIKKKKKKSKSQQMFYCLDYPPCSLSFTRSEHLARHIRKHTGERPFECHCTRRFSRLDNLRQHAQTIHQNEDIPPESLAASGARFQRQGRTDRARPTARARAATAAAAAGTPAGPGRAAHRRNALSMSSVASMSSSAGSSYGEGGARRRPPPLVMAGERRRGSHESRPGSPSSSDLPRHVPYPRPPTPTSATFSAGQSSPRWGPGMPSPPTFAAPARTTGLYPDTGRSPDHDAGGRRLSVPSGANPFHSPTAHAYAPPPLHRAYSPASSQISSPTLSPGGWYAREATGPVDHESRRRTWHPESRPAVENFTSRLQNVMNADTHYAAGPGPLPRAAIVPSQPVRLPGIASLVSMPRPGSPVPRYDPAWVTSPPRAPVRHESSYERPTSRHWDQGVARHGPDGAPRPPPDAGPESHRFEEPSSWPRPHAGRGGDPTHHLSAPVASVTPMAAKRHGWYHGPPPSMQQTRTAPAEPRGSEGGVPGLAPSHGWVARRIVPSPGYAPDHASGPDGAYTYGPGGARTLVPPHEQVPKSRDMAGLDALVAVATAEGDVKQEGRATRAY